MADDQGAEGSPIQALTDRLDAFRLLTADSDVERERILDDLGVRGRAESDIVRQQALRRPLAHPAHFEEAHRLVVRGLEVLDRNGVRAAPMPSAVGPLRPVASWVVQLVTRFIVRSHQNSLVDRLRKLYQLREANSAWGSPEHAVLRRARLQMQGLSADLKGEPLGIPTFLVGGAFLSGLFSGLGNAIGAAFGNPIVVVVLVVLMALLLGGVAWAVLFAAGVSRRRIRLALDEPLAGLYRTIGACGDPPEDQALQFAIYAIVLLVVAAIVVPAGIGILLSL
ncbi:MAG: hypothetical protein MUE78_08490 [Ilumatobacteraceae bacterium]|jgi:hypothetical protein|nr:hypothetical protein [Ilumatobacteraceae bacterium]